MSKRSLTPTTPHRDIYAEITSAIIAMLESGVVPWRSPILGQSKAGWPKNLDSGREYRGVNVFLLAFTAYCKGYGSAYWMTFNQAKAKGGHIRKGEKASTVVFFKPYETTDKQSGEVITVPVLRSYHVFNAEQCENVTIPDAPKFAPLNFSPIAEAEKIVAGYADAPTIEHGGSQAFYLPKMDAVHMPDQTRFVSAEAYYATLFHEFSHSTGHSRRLARGLDTQPSPFGSPDYGKEELIAEMSAAFLGGYAGITPATIENNSAYLGGWIKSLKGDKRLVIAAASAAQKSADWIRGVQPSNPHISPLDPIDGAD